MKTRRFGRTGWQVSEIGYGAWQIGGNQWGEVPDRTAEAAIETALDAGITFFDTARAYGSGRSELILGRVLLRTGMRDRVRVATKIPPLNRQWPAQAGTPLREAFPADWIRQNTRESIENLGFPPDVQQLHVWADNWTDDAEWVDALTGLRAEGCFSAFGVSVNSLDPGSAVRIARSGKVDSVQVIYNVFEQAPKAELFPAAAGRDVAIVARVPLDEGSLAGKLTRDTKFGANEFRASYFRGERLGQTVDRVERLRPLLETKDQTMAAGALRFCLSAPEVTTVIAGSISPVNIRANAAVSGRGPLDPAVVEQLREHAWPRSVFG